jgi:hypothetical protein
MERSLFAPVQESELNGESDVAVYLEGEKALVWWHRRVALNHNASRWRAEAVDSTTSTQATEVLKFLSSNFEWDPPCRPHARIDQGKWRTV